MALVVLHARLPSIRLGLASMLAECGHAVVSEGDAPETVVWVLDAPDQLALEGFTARSDGDEPGAAVVLTDDAAVAGWLARAGLRGWACLGRDIGAADLDLAVRAAESGLVLLDLPAVAAALQPAGGSGPVAGRPGGSSDPLTPRELQVLQLVAQGLPNKGIAQALSITENTAKFHVASVCAKLGAASRTEAVTLAARRGLILL